MINYKFPIRDKLKEKLKTVRNMIKLSDSFDIKANNKFISTVDKQFWTIIYNLINTVDELKAIKTAKTVSNLIIYKTMLTITLFGTIPVI